MLLVLLLSVHNLHLLGDGIPRFPRLNRYKAGLALSQELPPPREHPQSGTEQGAQEQLGE